MSLESELKKLTEQVKRVADSLEGQTIPGPENPGSLTDPRSPAADSDEPEQEDTKKPAQTEGKAERQPSKGRTRKPAPKDNNPDDPGEAEEEPQKIPPEDAKLLRKQAGEKLMDLIGVKGKPTAIKLLEEFDAKVLKDVPAERLSEFMDRTEALMEAK